MLLAVVLAVTAFVASVLAVLGAVALREYTHGDHRNFHLGYRRAEQVRNVGLVVASILWVSTAIVAL